MAVSRREFLGTSAAATAAVWSASWTKSVFAQDTADIRIAVIGFNGQGSGHIEARTATSSRCATSMKRC